MTSTTAIGGADAAAASDAHRRVDLETRFVLCALVLVASGAAVFFVLQAQRGGVFATVGLIVGIAALAASYAHFALFKPTRQLVVAARALASAAFSKRVGSDQPDEFGSLALEMQTLSQQLEAAQLASDAHLAALDQLRHSDRIATLGRLASSVAHELGNPLSVIELRAQLITSGDADTLAKVRLNAAVIIEQAHCMTRIIDEILSFARMQPARITRLDLGSVVRQAITLSEHTSKKQKTQIVLELPPGEIEIEGDAGKLLQVVVNLVVNGLQATPNGGTLEVRIRDEVHSELDGPQDAARDYVCITVVDHGVGIAKELQDRVFEPFFSTRSSEGGTGLGLSIAQGIAQEHDGWISMVSELGHGSTFKVHLPRRCALHGDPT